MKDFAAALLLIGAAVACGGEPADPPPEAPAGSEPVAQVPVAEVETPPAPDSPAATAPLGLWVLCEGSQRVLENPERLDALFDYTRQVGATDLFVQVYRGGRAWFDSTHADAAPYQKMLEASGTDSLRELLARAETEGVRVHAWVNALSLAGNRKAPILNALGRDAVLVDHQGRSVLDYPELEVPQPDRRYYRMGTPAVWLDPGAPGVAETLATTFAELLARYPGFTGLHLDYIRYPVALPIAPGSRFGVGLHFGYGEPTRARFHEQTGLEAPFGDSLRNANRWDEWRRDQVREVVRQVRAAATAAAPHVQLSAAVGAYADRFYLSEGQDWQRWLEEDLIEFAVPMAYTLDDRMYRYLAERFSSGPNAHRIWLGHGTWLFAKRPERALGQLSVARESGSRAQVLFSYDSIADHPELAEALVAERRGER